MSNVVSESWMLVKLCKRCVVIELSSPYRDDLEQYLTKPNERIVRWFKAENNHEYIILDGETRRIS